MQGDRHHQVQERRPLLFRSCCQEAHITTGLQEECGAYDHSEARRIEEPTRVRSFSSQGRRERRKGDDLLSPPEARLGRQRRGALGAGSCGRCEGGRGQYLVWSCAAVEYYFKLHTGELLFCLQLAEQTLH